jgi:neutral ceramidase
MKKYSVFGSLVQVVIFLNIALSAQAEPFRIGVASRVINNELGRWVQGAGVPIKAKLIRDDLEANALFLKNDQTEILMVSCDLVGLEPAFNAKLREAMGTAAGIAPRDILISCTHTHGGPSLVRTNYLMDLDTLYMQKLTKELVALAVEAVKSAVPGKIGWIKDELKIGHNRRLTWADGSHTMGGDTKRKDFTGLEGPDDPQHLGMFATTLDGSLLAILYHNTTHPTIFYGAGIYSADFPGEVRKSLRGRFGQRLPVLFLNGAQGDIQIENSLNPLHETNEQKIKRLSTLIVEKTFELYEKVTYDENPILKHEYDDLKVNVRLPDPKAVADGKKVLARIDAGENIRGMEMIMAFGAVHLQERFGAHPFDTLPVHAIRIGELAVVTQPCELYCQFGLDIKRRSPSRNTIIVGLTDGYHGYCPTVYGLLGGGYSGAPISWVRLEPYAGYKIVETASRLLNKLWANQ